MSLQIKSVGIDLSSNNNKVFTSTYTTAEQLSINLKNLLLTIQGERVLNPMFGTTIYTLLFEPATNDLNEMIKNIITDAVTFWMPFITISKIDIEHVNISNNQISENGISIILNAEYNNQLILNNFNIILSPSIIEEYNQT